MYLLLLNTIKKNIKVLTILFIVAIIATSIPYISARIISADKWAGVTPTLSSDALRYFARSNDITRGNFYPHNPYFIEHRDDPSPTPSVNDAIIALPQILGLSFNASYYINIFFWSLLYLVLLLFLVTELGIAVQLKIPSVLWIYLGTYAGMLRPGAMQIVFPLYVLFLICFYRELVGKSKSILPLAIIAGISAYSYIYLFMTIFSVMGLYGLVLILQKRWHEAVRIFYTALLAGVLAIPHFYLVHSLSGLEFYQKTMAVFAFIYTHLPQIEIYYYGRWILLGLIVIGALRIYFPQYVSKNISHFLIYIGGGIGVTMISNIIIGRDFDIAVHVANFGIVWYLFVGVIIFGPLVAIWGGQKGQMMKILPITFLFAILVLQMFLNIPRQMSVYSQIEREVLEVQEYHGAINWLATQPEGVVLGPEKFMMYLPTLAKQYVLYTSHGALFLVGEHEMRERFLLYNAFNSISVEQFVARHSEYDGSNPELLAKTSLMRYKLCNFFSAKNNCEKPKEEIDYVPVGALLSQFSEYYPLVRENILSEYAKYHVRYIVTRQGGILPSELDGACLQSFQDEYFSICTMQY